MRHKKAVATLVGVALMTVLVIGYAMAQDAAPTGAVAPSAPGPGLYGPTRSSGRMTRTPPGGRGAPGMYGPGGPGMGPSMPMTGPGLPPAFMQMSAALHVVGRMRDACFDPEIAGVIAIGGLKDDVRRGPKALAEDLEDQLLKTKSLGLRNAIRMELKEIYKRTGDEKKALKNLRAMLAENDKAIQEAPRDNDEDDD